MIKKISERRHLAGLRILFLGYDQDQTRLCRNLIADGHELWHTTHPIVSTGGFDLAISFGYRHIIRGEPLSAGACPIVNLHIGYLPFNRGAHPNFWSYFDGTPSGVTIHLIDEGIDTGPIIAQRCLDFPIARMTFQDTYDCLINEIETMFILRKSELLRLDFEAVPQRGPGSFHRSAQLPDAFGGWNTVIAQELARLDRIALAGPPAPRSRARSIAGGAG